jgi:hypothetical protein
MVGIFNNYSIGIYDLGQSEVSILKPLKAGIFIKSYLPEAPN